jgi:hypothetical protein
MYADYVYVAEGEELNKVEEVIEDQAFLGKLSFSESKWGTVSRVC